ncbi:MAG: HAD-IC family P-type ATPase, partial [Nitrosomonas sp.]|nr:HAD-IC family P-type ATPase [Nitrosomonas sp.]
VIPVESISAHDLVQIAATLEQGSAHPLAKAVLDSAKKMHIQLHQVKDFSAITGNGIIARIDTVEYLLGSPKFLSEHGAAIDRKQVTILQTDGKTVIGLAIASGSTYKILGYIGITDRLRTTSIQAVKRLQAMGIEVMMLTGDNTITADAIAKRINITNYRAEVLPQDKAAEVMRLKANGRFTGMIGDGINDAPALAAADVSFAIGAGSDVAIQAADITLMRDDLMSVADAISLSRATLRKIRQNLFFAFFYNTLGIPLAALGMLNPIIAGAAMAMSSISVVSNSLLLKRWRAAS